MPGAKTKTKPETEPEGDGDGGGDSHLALARESLDQLLSDTRVPQEVRDSLGDDYRQVRAMLDKLEHGHVHIAVLGRVSVGKSALLNALLGRKAFSTSPLHGETRHISHEAVTQFQDGGVFLIDTPGIDEVDGEGRERLAHDVAARSDLVLFVVEGDITDTELGALRAASQQRPVLLVLNKAERYSQSEQQELLSSLMEKTRALIVGDLIMASADPAERLVISIDAAGNETEQLRRPAANIVELKDRLWKLLEAEGKTLSALNASLFAGELSEQVASRVLQARRTLAVPVIRTYCIGKGVAVAINPIPVADLAAAAVIDLGMVVHLSRLYGMPLTKKEAGALVKVIGSQILLLMGTVWAVHLISSLLKLGSGGVSTVVTAAAQGAVAYYSTRVVGDAAEQYLANGKSWGELGPKRVVQDILDNLDRDSILEQARIDIRTRLRS